MTERKQHLRLEGFSKTESYTSKALVIPPKLSPRDRNAHGKYLLGQYDLIMAFSEERKSDIDDFISETTGVYVEITSFTDEPLTLDSLDTLHDYKLCSLKVTGDSKEIAVIFVPDLKRKIFKQKIDEYLNPDRDSKKNNNPRNQRLLNSIESIKLAQLRSFWTDKEELYPENPNQEVWWELWLTTKTGDVNPIESVLKFCERVGVKASHTTLSFFSHSTILVKATENKLEKATELLACLSELRLAKDTPYTFIAMSPKEQVEWTNNLLERTDLTSNGEVAVSVLDTGINYLNPLLAVSASEERSVSWAVGWPLFDGDHVAGPYNDHGSLQAGISTWGNLSEVLLSSDRICVNHIVESGRIIPPIGSNQQELYGAITKDTAYKLEINNANTRRVYSLAITSESERDGGLPSSWSAEIDFFVSGYEDEIRRLFIISTGNNRKLMPTVDLWTQFNLAEIEDPAQSWNAVTVGAYTELTTIEDPVFDGWSPWSEAGDIAPASRSSVNWEWANHAPYKPDVVAEGGNRLLSPNANDISDADSVSLLTTSGRSTGPLFETTRDSSSATALVSHLAAKLMTEYENFWPETIRALIIHSASWTPRMNDRFKLLSRDHKKPNAKKLMLKTFGYGVPDIELARYSAEHQLTLVAQDELQPFQKKGRPTPSKDPSMNELAIYELPWPVIDLQSLGGTEVRLKITLSYFVEPNPGRKGYRGRYSYQSHGLRFSVIKPNQSFENFKAQINKESTNDSYDGPEGDGEGWFFGPQIRTRGSIHSDVWTGTAADLSAMNKIAVFPVGGWWKYKTAADRWKQKSRYSLIVSIETPKNTVDIYSVVENMLNIPVVVEV